jgi:hypothetical protein
MARGVRASVETSVQIEPKPVEALNLFHQQDIWNQEDGTKLSRTLKGAFSRTVKVEQSAEIR